MRLLNLPLMSRWQNWVIILLMLLIATFAINSLSRLVLSKNQSGAN